MPLEKLQDTSSFTTIAPHKSSSYPDYLSLIWDKDTQWAVVWTRLWEHRKLANCSLAKINKRYKALRQEQQTQVESSHESSSRDTSAHNWSEILNPSTWQCSYITKFTIIFKCRGHKLWQFKRCWCTGTMENSFFLCANLIGLHHGTLAPILWRKMHWTAKLHHRTRFVPVLFFGGCATALSANFFFPEQALIQY